MLFCYKSCLIMESQVILWSNTLKRFTSYLSDRRQYVTYSGVVSTMNYSNCGVPQGSILRSWSGSDIKTIESNIDTELTQISLWLNINKLSLNIKKTQRNGLRWQIDGESIYEVYEINFLWVIIDNKMNWKDHISYIFGKISRNIARLLKRSIWIKMVSWLCITLL